jgi:hypothetical protein
VIHLTDAAAIHLAGQLGHAVNGGTFTFDHFLMQRTTTGGEYSGASQPLRFTVNDSAFIECPDDSEGFVDGDNDGLYLVHGNHSFTNTLVGFTKDDGIDSGGSGAANLTFQKCWFESSFHEANALSGTGKIVNHIGGVFLNCGQGLESGYDAPTGNMIGCLATGNLTGGRFGDNYNWTYNGFLRVTNSLMIHNDRDVWGMCFADWTYRTTQMDVRSNLLGVSDAHWPANGIWNPGTDAARLMSFIAGDAGSPVGVGFAVRSNLLGTAALTQGIPVRLSRFSTNVVSVNYTAESPAGVLASGTLTFQPGETVKNVDLSIANPQSHDLIAVSLFSPAQAEITGLAQVFSVGTNAPATTTTLIPFGGTWKYHDQGIDLGTAWIPSGYDDSGWSNGPARLGFNTGTGNTGFATVVGYGTDPNNKYRTTYFRKTFNIASASAFTNLFLEVYRDDGLVVYLNGAQIYHDNVPASFSYSTLATNASDNGSVILSATLALAGLGTGTNVLAAEVHQSSADSSDLVYDLRLTGNLLPVPPTLRSSILGGRLVLYWSDASYALEEAPELTGPWTLSGGTNPQPVSFSSSQKFFRLKR